MFKRFKYFKPVIGISNYMGLAIAVGIEENYKKGYYYRCLNLAFLILPFDVTINIISWRKK
jgi:hypothetical protein